MTAIPGTARSGQATWITAAALFCACTASWDSIVKYSPEPAELSVPAEVYRATLAEYVQPPWPGSVVLAAAARSDAGRGGPDDAARLPGHWVDTLRQEARVALARLSPEIPADRASLALAARSLNLRLVTTETSERVPGRERLPVIWLSRAGFNRDSTVAAVRIESWCGLVCGAGQTLLLARRPGTRWQIWYALTDWIS